jgi:hypothetical protein|tara:strand:+ start:1259 stop:2011 length:753 start_codon:yes stop_codon:yes gene_type:complete
MISCKLEGGLGNYLFQIGAASSLAHSNNTTATFDFNNARQVHKNIKSYTNTILRNINTEIPTIEYSFTEAKDFTYNEIPYKENLLLDGYFQSEKYLNREHILQLYKIDDISKKYIDDTYGDIFHNTVSIHIRRGDYLNRQSHPVQPMEYYSKAMGHFSDCKFIIVSDDILWCKANFVGDNFIFIDDNDDYIDLYIMAMCTHNIIANSSFSWWGAYMNTNHTKKVIAPLQWFGKGKSINSSNIISKNWIPI